MFFFAEAPKPSKAVSSVKYDFQPLKYPYREDEQINLYLRLKRYLNCVKNVSTWSFPKYLGRIDELQPVNFSFNKIGAKLF